MTELLRLTGREKVLEIGTGSGYQAAVLAELAARVCTIERIPRLATRARELLEALGYSNVWVRAANGTLGWPDEAPFDRILVAAGGPSVPPPLFEQLAEGGRMVMPVGEATSQVLQVIEKIDGEMRTTRALRVRVREAGREVRVGAVTGQDGISVRGRSGRRGVAQLGSAPASGAGGRWFKSSRPDHFLIPPRGRGGRVGDGRWTAPTFVREMSAAGANSAAEILVEGRVQGVGYRNFVQRKAAQLGLAGYVMNLKDGSVRVRVEGSREAIEELDARPEKGPPLARVESLAVTWRPPTGRFTSFGIRYAEFDS